MIAQVMIDVDALHLDRPFDYQIPEKLLGEVKVGCQVQVKWGSRRVFGWVIKLLEQSQYEGKLGVIQRCYTVPLISEDTFKSLRYLADKYCVPMVQLISQAVPARHLKAQQQTLDLPALKTENKLAKAAGSYPAVEQMYGVDSILDASARSPWRAAIQAVPGDKILLLQDFIEMHLRQGLALVVVTPTADQAQRLFSSIREQVGSAFSDSAFALLLAEDAPKDRFGAFLRIKLGISKIVIGTRAAAWAPIDKGTIVIWDEGSEHLRERRNPYLDSLDIAVARSHMEGLSLATYGYSRSLKTEALVHSGWVTPLPPRPEILRASAPKIRVFDSSLFEREGFQGVSAIPRAAKDMIAQALEAGPVLVQTSMSEKVTLVGCQVCGGRPKCITCQKAIDALPTTKSNENSEVLCPHCGALLSQTQENLPAQPSLLQCVECSADIAVKVRRSGAEHLGRELGQMFPGVPLLVSTGTRQITRQIAPSAQIVVATAGAEPQCPGGYQSVIVTDASVLLSFDELGIQMEAMRRWLSAFGLCKPGAICALVGDIPPQLRQAIVLFRPDLFAASQLAERFEVGFFPARWVVAIEGTTKAVTAVVTALEERVDTEKIAFEVLASFPMPEIKQPGSEEPEADEASEAEALFDLPEPDDMRPIRTLVSASPRGATDLMKTMRSILVSRALNHETRVHLIVNPADILPAGRIVS